MSDTRKRIYCAGPLFTDKERQEMAELAKALEDAGYSTFLPQRDGLELTRCVEYLIERGHSRDEASLLMSRAIFALDVYQVLHGCDALVANLNGRVPDEGTVSEASMAWARGKVVVGYKADSRTVFDGQDNPLVVGLFDFQLCATIQDVPAAVRERLQAAPSPELHQAAREEEINSHISLGSSIALALQKSRGLDAIVKVILGFSPASTIA